MASIADQRAAAGTALTAASVTVSSSYALQKPPSVVIAFQSGDLLAGPARKMEATFRFICLAGSATQENAAKQLDDLTQLVYTTLLALAGWSLGSIGSDVLLNFPVGVDPSKQITYLTRDVAATVLVDI